MKIKLENRLLILLIFIVIITLSPHIFKTGMEYDGGLYATLGQSLYKDHAYQFNAQPGDIPPVYPILLGLFYSLFGENGIYIVSPFFSVILVTAVYFLLRENFKPEYAFFGAMLFFSSKMIFTYSVYLLRDITLLAFLMLCYLVYLRNAKNPTSKNNIALGFLMATAFLTKYVAFVYLVPIFIYAAYKKERWFLKSILSGLIIIFPWSIWSYINHGTPLVMYSSSSWYLHNEMRVGVFRTDVWKYFMTWFFPPILLVSFIGIGKRIIKKSIGSPSNLYLFLFIITFLSGAVWPVQTDRYLLAAVFPAIYFTVDFLSNYNKKKLIYIFLIFAILFQFGTSSVHVYSAREKYILLEDAGHFLRDNTQEDSKIASPSYRQINFFSYRQTFELPVKRYSEFIKTNNISYVVLDTYEKAAYEKANPNIYLYFSNQTLIKTFSLKEDWVKIYEIENADYPVPTVSG